MNIHSLLQSFRSLSITKKIILIAVSCAIFGFIWNKTHTTQNAPQYQTETAQKGTLITSVSASGTVTAGAASTITTNASGVVQKVYVKNGDSVKAGQKIATLSLDQVALQRQTSSWASYLQAKNQLASAQAKINSLQAAEFSANQKFMNDAVSRGLSESDPTFIQEKATWLQAEADYKNQSDQIAQSRIFVNSSWISYQEVSPDILSPITGTVSNFILAPGVTIAAQTANASGAVSSQKVGTVLQPDGKIQATVSLSEIDVVKVSPNQKVTLTLDAFPDKTFTGKVLIIDTNGQVSSGVTTYPTTIAFDSSLPSIYPNMAVNAKIITNVKDNVILVPTSAVQTTNGQSAVRVLKNGNLTNVTATIGDSNDTQTEVTSGINEGDTVVTAVTAASSTTKSTTSTSVFGGGLGGNRGFGGGNAVRIQAR